jgi:hypothetical protein
MWHCLVLAGYAILGRGFAYAGIKPVYIGEITLIFGLAAMLMSGRFTVMAASIPARFLLILIIWTAIRTIPYIGRFGIDAIRDSMICLYGLFAFIIASILISEPSLFKILLIRYRRFAIIFLFCGWAVFLVSQTGLISVSLPGSPAPLGLAKGGDLLVHLAGTAALAISGMMTPTITVIVLLFINFAAGAAFNRGGMLAFISAAAVCSVLLPVHRLILTALWALAVFAVLVLLINPEFSAGGRKISPQSLFTNVKSVFSKSEERLDSTREWRMRWWSDIVKYTFTGPMFFSGKGFGINLADDDGYQVLGDKSLRSPHNGHLTILARAGVPGFALWLLVNISWVWSMTTGFASAKKNRDTEWQAIFVFLASVWAAFIVNAAFDVFLEGPAGGIWFWSVFGTGIAAVWIHRFHPEAIRI